MPVDDLTHDEIVRIYGPWAEREPTDAAALMTGYPSRWWIAGGWAIEAFTGVPREHGDLDLSIPRPDLPMLRRHLSGRLDLWAAHKEQLILLLPQDGDSEPPVGCGNIWTRDGGAGAWQYDVILMDTDGPLWTFKRDRRISRPLDDIVWNRDAIPYLRPEIQLLHKARALRAKDQADFDATWPLLDIAARDWLRRALASVDAHHVWLRDPP